MLQRHQCRLPQYLRFRNKCSNLEIHQVFTLMVAPREKQFKMLEKLLHSKSIAFPVKLFLLHLELKQTILLSRACSGMEKKVERM
jgi:hypothetical protein